MQASHWYRTSENDQELANHDANLPEPEFGLEVEVHLGQALANHEGVGVVQPQVPQSIRPENLIITGKSTRATQIASSRSSSNPSPVHTSALHCLHRNSKLEVKPPRGLHP